jgi:hypothetical protein
VPPRSKALWVRDGRRVGWFTSCVHDKRLGTSEIIIVVAGALAFVASFLPWVDSEFGDSQSAWGDAFPLLTWVGLFGAVMAAQVLLRTFSTVSMPSGLLGFSWPDLHLILAFFTALITVSWLIAGEEQAAGFWLSLVASIALVVGAWMLRNEASAAPTSPPPGSAGGLPPL